MTRGSANWTVYASTSAMQRTVLGRLDSFAAARHSPVSP
jgi:hypothetical protein